MEAVVTQPDLPETALAIRQPWAHMIACGLKDIENRSAAAIRIGRMVPGRICIHASRNMLRQEYEAAAQAIRDIGHSCPPPHELAYGAIIGVITVTGIVEQSDSPWFLGPCGLMLADAQAIEPIPAKGRLGYYRWERADTLAPLAKWMQPHPTARPAQLPLIPAEGV